MENEFVKRNMLVLAWMILGLIVLANIEQVGGILQSVVKLLLTLVPNSIKLMKAASLFIALVVIAFKILLFVYFLKGAMKNTILNFPKKLYVINLVLLLVTYIITFALSALSSAVMSLKCEMSDIGELAMFGTFTSASIAFLNSVLTLVAGIVVYNRLKPLINSGSMKTKSEE